MKKLLLLLSCIVILSLGASAQESVNYTKPKYASSVYAPGPSFKKSVAATPAGRASGADGYKYTMADEISSAYQYYDVQPDQRVYLGFEFEKGEIKNFIGDKITHVNVPSGVGDSGVNLVTDVTVFITKGLGENPIITQHATLSSTPWTENCIQLDNPYEITDDTPLYIGYYFNYQGDCGGFIVTDANPSDKPSNFYAFRFRNGADWPSESEWTNLAPVIGSLCMSVTIEGDNFPVDLAEIRSADMPSATTPSNGLSYDIKLRNNGINEINSIEVTTTIGGASQTSAFSNLSIPAGLKHVIHVDNISLPATGIYEVTSTISKVNGVENAAARKSTSGKVICYTGGYPRNMVLEEGTGAWCGWCPAGIVMFEYVREKYSDRLIPIAVHCNDRMAIPEYQDFIDDLVDGFPTVVVNRMESYFPDTYLADNLYRKVQKNPAYARVDLFCQVNGKKLSITSETEFSLSTDIEHQLSFVVVEDGVGPYIQNNKFGPGSGMGEWDNAGEEKSILFNDVARHIDSYPGIPGSLPSSVEEGTKYTFNREMEITNVTSGNFRVIAMITNSRTGEIVNAATASAEPSGIDGITDDVAECDVFSISGICMAAGTTLSAIRSSLPAGIYVVRYHNGKAAKIAIR